MSRRHKVDALKNMIPDPKREKWEKHFKKFSKAQRVELDRLLIEGKSNQSVARKIQTEWKLWGKITFKAAKERINRYYKEVIVVEKAKALFPVIVKDPNSLSSDIDVLKELMLVAAMQKTRLLKQKAREDQMPLITKVVSDEIYLMTHVLEKIAGIQMRLDILRKPDGSTANSENTVVVNVALVKELLDKADNAIDVEYEKVDK